MNQDCRCVHLRRYVGTTWILFGPVKIHEITGNKVTWCRYKDTMKAQSVGLGPKTDQPWVHTDGI